MTSFRFVINNLPTPFISAFEIRSLPPPHFLVSPHFQFKANLRVSCSVGAYGEKNQFKARVRILSSFSPDVDKNRVIEKIQSIAKALIFTVAAALMIVKFSHITARAETLAVVQGKEEKEGEKTAEEEKNEKSTFAKLYDLAQSHSEAIDALAKNSEDGEDEKVIKMMKLLISAHPLDLEWKFSLAALYNERGEKGEAQKVYEEILDKDPLCLDALFLNAILMDQCGEGQAAIQMLKQKLNLAREEEDHKDKAARNVRLILALIEYLQRNVDKALEIYEELAVEDPVDHRTYFYQYVIYGLLGRDDEAKAELAKLQELCPKDFKYWMMQ